MKKSITKDKAALWLETMLDQDWVKQEDALLQGGFSKRTIYRAKDALGLVPDKRPDGTLIWRRRNVDELTKQPEFLDLFERFVLAVESIAQNGIAGLASKAAEQAPKPETIWRKIVKHLSDINLAIDVNSDDRDSPSLLVAEAHKTFPGVPDEGEFGIFKAVDKVIGFEG